MYAYIQICMHTCVYIQHVNKQIYIHVHTKIQTYMYVHKHTCTVYIHISVYTYKCKSTCIMYTCLQFTCIHASNYKHMHVYLHVYVCILCACTCIHTNLFSSLEFKNFNEIKISKDTGVIFKQYLRRSNSTITR